MQAETDGGDLKVQVAGEPDESRSRRGDDELKRGYDEEVRRCEEKKKGTGQIIHKEKKIM